MKRHAAFAGFMYDQKHAETRLKHFIFQICFHTWYNQNRVWKQRKGKEKNEG